MIFSDRHRSLSFLYIDIPGGPPAGHSHLPQIINQKNNRQLSRTEIRSSGKCNNARHWRAWRAADCQNRRG
ncbi:hypothetical protein CUJ89_20715 [Burkholderia pyrrocinia]|uniref:Uncharacterized protein n=1 Tax=Burkholderia pyrrocinia TaxID=60550 RepID=A0A2Z5N1U8_BURPY|nr:hypothetical protein CUJ89_20715 [Burkholderia pyrrocinia]